MSHVPIAVVKVGGSLLLWDEMPRRLHAWLDEQPPAAYVLIAGLGQLGDFVREADRQFSLGEEPAHWLCIDALSITARLLSHALGGLALIDSFTSMGEMAGPYVFDPRLFLVAVELRAAGTHLPHTWDATTDSISARVAECLNAERLVLVKSCDPPGDTIDEASLAGFVDRHFPLAAKSLPQVECVNLRSGQTFMLEGPRQ